MALVLVLWLMVSIPLAVVTGRLLGREVALLPTARPNTDLPRAAIVLVVPRVNRKDAKDVWRDPGGGEEQNP